MAGQLVKGTKAAGYELTLEVGRECGALRMQGEKGWGKEAEVTWPLLMMDGGRIGKGGGGGGEMK